MSNARNSESEFTIHSGERVGLSTRIGVEGNGEVQVFGKALGHQGRSVSYNACFNAQGIERTCRRTELGDALPTEYAPEMANEDDERGVSLI